MSPHKRLSDDELLRILNEELRKIQQNNVCRKCSDEIEQHTDEEGNPATHALVNLYLAERAQIVAMCAAALLKTPYPDVHEGPVVDELRARGLWEGQG